MGPKRKAASKSSASSTSAITIDFTKLKVAELKNECIQRNLDGSGKKADLLKRLAEYEKPKTNAASKRSAPSSSSSTSNTIDFTKLKVAELKDECLQRNLDDSGKKADLLERLVEYEKQNGPSSSKNIKNEVKKEDDDDEKEDEDGGEQKELSIKEKLKALAEEEKKNKKKRTFKVDSECGSHTEWDVIDDYDCMLNQTNIGNNNNKFYIIQLLQTIWLDGSFIVWTRWGRVGETGQNSKKTFSDFSDAEKEFKKKFKDKTKNDWSNRHDFKPVKGKYTLIEMDGQDDDDDDDNAMEEKLSKLDAVDGPSAPKKIIKPCTLDNPTQALIKLLFDHDMFKEAMTKLNLDVKKMPLGKISKSQIAKGFEVLEELQTVLHGGRRAKLTELTSLFYTLIPHNFGRQRPPVISDFEVIQKKMDMLTILGDIEIAQSLQKDVKNEDQSEEPHPYDVNYGLLNCSLKHVDTKTDTYKIISNYVENTKSGFGGPKLIDVWELERENAGKRFSEHKDLSNRKLLWHGTNVAVVVAILKSGLRIMPHSGGRVGRGIYFASEHGKSAAYVGTAGDRTGIMFLSEVALGKQNIITRDDSSLRKPPSGYDSVLAQGRQEPDPSKDVTIKLEENDVIVPQGKPKSTGQTGSSFHQSEYLIYKESQCQLRYLLKFKF